MTKKVFLTRRGSEMTKRVSVANAKARLSSLMA